MKVNNVTISHPLTLVPLGNRLYAIANDVKIKVFVDEGVFNYTFKRGFETNFRSGGNLVDCVVDQFGNQNEQISWLVHDCNYGYDVNDEHPTSKQMADKLLKAMLEYAGMGIVKRNTVYYSVKWFGQTAYDEVCGLTELNKDLFKFEWSDK